MWEAVTAGQTGGRSTFRSSRDQAEEWEPCGSRGGEMFKHREKKRGAKVTRCGRVTWGWGEHQGDVKPPIPGFDESRGRSLQPTGPERIFQEEKKSMEKKIKAIKIFRERNKARHSEK